MEAQASGSRQFSTFYIADQLYGVDVMRVQEVTTALPMTRVPLAPRHVRGLINLRGQVSTAIDVRALFGLGTNSETNMNVVCRIGDQLYSFIVDKIGDVMEVPETAFESSPDTIPEEIKRFMFGVYKIPGAILSVLEIDRLSDSILKNDFKNTN
ncbi:MAG: chemotaxis protein CheW [Bdellovibrionota bacterium]